jgi:hypothetical protein
MHRLTRSVGVLVATTAAAGGLTLVASPSQAVAPGSTPSIAHRGLLDLPLPTPDQLPQLSGSPVVGEVLTVTEPLWNVLPGALDSDITWLCNGSPIPGTQGLWTYVPTEAQAGCQVSAKVVTTALGFLPLEMITNTLTIAGIVDTAVTPEGAPTIKADQGTPKVGTTLTVSVPPSWKQEGVTTSYQWLRAGEPITGQTATTYKLVSADLDKAISVTATGTKANMTDGVTTSNQLTAVLGDAPSPTVQPTIQGTPGVGSTLTANPGTWGTGETPTYAYQWRRDDAAIAGATTSTYHVTAADVGRTLTVTVTATRTGYRPGTFRAAGVAVGKLTSSLAATASKKTLKQGQKATMKLVLSVPGLAGASGPVTIYDGAKVLKQGSLHDGAATVQLGKLKPGVHRLKAVFTGTDSVAGSTSKVVKVTVKKVKKKK